MELCSSSLVVVLAVWSSSATADILSPHTSSWCPECPSVPSHIWSWYSFLYFFFFFWQKSCFLHQCSQHWENIKTKRRENNYRYRTEQLVTALQWRRQQHPWTQFPCWAPVMHIVSGRNVCFFVHGRLGNRHRPLWSPTSFSSILLKRCRSQVFLIIRRVCQAWNLL